MIKEYEIPNFTEEELDLTGKIIKGAEKQTKAQKEQLEKTGKIEEMGEEKRKEINQAVKHLHSIRTKLTSAEEASTIETGG